MVEIIPGYGRMDEVLALVKEYTDMIAGQGGDVVECLKSQHLDAELLDMEKSTACPGGGFIWHARTERLPGVRRLRGLMGRSAS